MQQQEFLIAVKTDGAFVMRQYDNLTVQAFDLVAGETAIAATDSGGLWLLRNIGGTKTAFDILGLINAKIDVSQKGVANGVAPLGVDMRVPAQFLPGYVDDVIDSYAVGTTPFAANWLSASAGGTPLTPEVGKIYVVISAGPYLNRTYRYSGTTYVEISPSLVVGTTTGTAYDGGLGTALKTLTDNHIANKNNPHETTKAQVGLTNVVDGAKPGIAITIAVGAWAGAQAPYTATISIGQYSAMANGKIIQFADNKVAGVTRETNGNITLTSNIKTALTVYIL